MDDHKKFVENGSAEVARQGQNSAFQKLSIDWMNESIKENYTYHFEWLGRPIIQMPQDMIGHNKLFGQHPDLIIETGVASGSLIFYASLLELLETCGISSGTKVLGIDIDIREHNRLAIEKHPLSKRIEMIEGSSVDVDTVDKVKQIAKKHKKIMVVLDSNHTHEHVLQELELYGPITTKGCYCVVLDTVINDLNDSFFQEKSWGNSNNPKTAVIEFLKRIEGNKNHEKENIKVDFEVDHQMTDSLMLTVAPNGFLKRI